MFRSTLDSALVKLAINMLDTPDGVPWQVYTDLYDTLVKSTINAMLVGQINYLANDTDDRFYLSTENAETLRNFARRIEYVV